MRIDNQNVNRELMNATKCLTEGIYKIYALGHEKEGEALTALVNIIRTNIESSDGHTKERFEEDYVDYCKSLRNYLNEVINQLPEPLT